ncbi:MAG: carboxypeptidase-like regulatory domain-containing protein [Flammeovirgaceae bacterium]
MRTLYLTMLFIFSIHGLFGQTNVLDKQIDFSVQEGLVSDVLVKLAESAQVSISFSASFFKQQEQKLTLSFKNTRFEEVLQAILAGTSVSYKVIGAKVLLFKVKPKFAIISGFITDEDTGERLIAATIYCPQLHQGALTNEYGFYSLKLPVGKTELQFRYLGSKSKSISYELTEDVQLNIGLKTTVRLEEVVVKPESSELSMILNSKSEGIQLLTEFVEMSPNLGGESDLVRTLELLPGIQSGIDGLGGLQVRGSENGHHLMMLDGVPVYIPYHLMGLYSIYNTSAIQSATLFKGMLPARYGGRLSSFLDVRMREGNQYKWQTEIGSNLLTSKILIEGPLKRANDKEQFASILFSARYGYPNLLFKPVFNEAFFERNNPLDNEFYDVNLKLNANLSKKDRIYFSVFTGSDNFIRQTNFDADTKPDDVPKSRGELSFNWGNTVSALRWNHVFNKQLFVNTTLTYSNYHYQYTNLEYFFDDQGNFVDFYFINNNSNNQDVGMKVDIDYLPNPQHAMRFGFGSSARQFISQVSFVDDNHPEVREDALDGVFNIEQLRKIVSAPVYNVLEMYAYVEDQVLLSKTWQVDLGLRYSAFFHDKERFVRLEPRMMIKHDLSPKLHATATLTRTVQYLHLIPNTILRLPNDLWVPSTGNNLPQLAWQTEWGITYHPTKQLSFTCDVYYKAMNNLYTYPNNFNSLEELNELQPESYLLQGNGRAYGVETQFKYEGKQVGGVISHTLSKSDRQFDGLNDGQRFPFDFDQRHQVTCFTYCKIGKNWNIGCNWVFNTGGPLLHLNGFELGESLVRLTPSNGQGGIDRASSYHRLDVNATYQFKIAKTQHQLAIGIYNVYDRNNSGFFDIIDDRFGEPSPRLISVIPFMPSISYKLNL